MKIDRLELFEIEVALSKPYQLSKEVGTIIQARAIVIKITTDEGIVGFGEANPTMKIGGESSATVKATLRHDIGPRLINKNPLQISKIEKDIDDIINANWAAKAAVNIALYDIAGKAYGLPVYKLLGGNIVSKLPLLWPLGSGTVDDDHTVIMDKFKEGYRTFMLKTGALPIAKEIERIKAIRQNLQNEIYLIVDANQGWTVLETLEFVKGLDGYRIDMIEQPLKRSDQNGIEKVRKATHWLISADESLITEEDAKNLIDKQSADVFSIKIAKNGGIGKSQKISSLAQSYGLKCLMNSEIEFGITQSASLHLGCTLNNLVNFGHAYMSPLRISEDITNYEHFVEKGEVFIPEEPGLGISISFERLKHYTKDYIDVF